MIEDTLEHDSHETVDKTLRFLGEELESRKFNWKALYNVDLRVFSKKSSKCNLFKAWVFNCTNILIVGLNWCGCGGVLVV